MLKGRDVWRSLPGRPRVLMGGTWERILTRWKRRLLGWNRKAGQPARLTRRANDKAERAGRCVVSSVWSYGGRPAMVWKLPFLFGRGQTRCSRSPQTKPISDDLCGTRSKDAV